MKRKFSLLLVVLAFAVVSQSQTINDQAKASLELMQKKMFDCFSNGDKETFAQITGTDYITVNADGTYMNKAEAIELMPKFKGSTYEIIQKETRLYDNIAITTGRVKFYFKSILASDVYFTQTWTWRDNKWYFIGWQGTMTGQPKSYPVYITLILCLIAIGMILFIRRFIKRKRETHAANKNIAASMVEGKNN